MDDFLSVTEAAKRLGLSRARVLVFIYDGRLPAKKVGPQYIIDPNELRRLKAKILPPGRQKAKSKKRAKS
jgi:excisionase family DNA binding protein